VVSKRRSYRASPDDRREIIRLGARGLGLNEIAAEVGFSRQLVWSVLHPLGGVFRAEEPQPVGSSRLSLDERVEIRIKLEAGWSLRQIAELCGRAASTISREVAANGGRAAYAPMGAHRGAKSHACRPKATKLAGNSELCDSVTSMLERLWSPQQISDHLRAEFPEDPEMWVSHETIYKSLFVQGRGELRRELHRCLRSGRARRKSRNRLEKRGQIPDMVMISERPAEVEDRAVPGHWEGDLIIGKNGKSAIGTLVERATRYVILLHLPNRHTATEVRDAMTTEILRLPEHLRRSITWDQGSEMAEHVRFSVDTGVDVYFCDPHSPWQRGSNENTNGLLRQYFPKGTDLTIHTRHDLDAAADSLNTRPRKTLGGMTPSAQLTELLR
jgi:transposase, IS30 family